MQGRAVTNTSLVAKLRSAWRGFSRARRGNTTITFALAFIPIIGLVGAAIDYSRANSMRTAMQAAADTTALAISSTAATQSATDLNGSAGNYFSALFTRTDAQDVQVSATYSSTNGSTVVVNAKASMKTNFMGILGFKTIPIATSSTASWGGAKLRVALVLDNTGSMTETDATGTSKISALKTATHNLLATLKSAAQNSGDVEVSIIPFNNFVRVDPTSYASMSWINWGLNSGSGGSGDGGPGPGGGCNGGDDGSNPCNPTSTSWNGCFTDRNQPYDSQNTPPTSTNLSTYFPAVNCSLTQMMSLSHDWTSLNNKIDAMVAAGTTNQPIGEQSDERAGAAVRHEADHHPADGRPEHPRPLEHQPGLYRRPRAGRLQQHQGGGHHGLYGAGHVRQLERAAGLREPRHDGARRPEVFRADLGEPDHLHVQFDRHQHRQAPYGQIASAAAPCRGWKPMPPGRRSRHG
jgi:Flp pilus assembly protein TadG